MDGHATTWLRTGLVIELKIRSAVLKIVKSAVFYHKDRTGRLEGPTLCKVHNFYMSRQG